MVNSNIFDLIKDNIGNRKIDDAYFIVDDCTDSKDVVESIIDLLRK